MIEIDGFLATIGPRVITYGKVLVTDAHDHDENVGIVILVAGKRGILAAAAYFEEENGLAITSYYAITSKDGDMDAFVKSKRWVDMFDETVVIPPTCFLSHLDAKVILNVEGMVFTCKKIKSTDDVYIFVKSAIMTRYIHGIYVLIAQSSGRLAAIFPDIDRFAYYELTPLDGWEGVLHKLGEWTIDTVTDDTPQDILAKISDADYNLLATHIATMEDLIA